MIADWIKSIFIDNWMVIVGGIVGVLLLVRLLFAFVEHPADSIKQHWRDIVIVLLIAACVFGYTIITDQKVQLDNVEANNKILKDNNAKLLDAVAGVNSAIGKFDQYASDTKKHFESINADVKNSNTALAQQLSLIMKDKKPQTCEEALAYLIDANKGYAK